MALLTVTAADVRPLNGAVVRRAQAAETQAVGQCVYISSASGNVPIVTKAIATAVATSDLYGIIVAGDPSKPGSTTIAAGDAVDVCVFGPVAGVAGTAGACAFVSDTAGSFGDAVGTKSSIAGFMESATVLFIRPVQAARAA